MSSIKPGSAERPEVGTAIRRFFEAELMPLAQRYAKEHRPLFPRSADSSKASYFHLRTRTSMSRDDFVIKGVESPQAFAESLRTLWAASQHPEMASFARSMRELAALLRGGEESTDDVSPFIYVMF